MRVIYGSGLQNRTPIMENKWKMDNEMETELTEWFTGIRDIRSRVVIPFFCRIWHFLTYG